MKAIRVLVVDDSSFMREAVSRMLESEPLLRVVGRAHHGVEAIRLARDLNPDVITLDLEMPVMDGLETLAVLAGECNAPVLMLSAHTAPGAEATLKALDLGAADFLVKPGPGAGGPEQLRDELVVRVMALACRNAGPRGRARVHADSERSLPTGGFKLVVVGASTGGPRALQLLLGRLPADLGAGVLIVQHMPSLFTRQFATRLDDCGPVRVREARDGDEIRAGEALLAPGDFDLELAEVHADRARVRVRRNPADATPRPSVDALFHSAARIHAGRTVAVVLTGMGSDGAAGMRALHHGGAITLAQDEASCVVYGMPRACVEAGVVDRVMPLERMAGAIIEALDTGSRSRERNLA